MSTQTATKAVSALRMTTSKLNEVRKTQITALRAQQKMQREQLRENHQQELKNLKEKQNGDIAKMIDEVFRKIENSDVLAKPADFKTIVSVPMGKDRKTKWADTSKTHKDLKRSFFYARQDSMVKIAFQKAEDFCKIFLK